MTGWKLRDPHEKAKYLSISSAKVYGQCPLSWKKQYLEKGGPAFVQTPAMLLGSAMHEVMQCLNKWRVQSGAFPTGDDLGLLIERGLRQLTPAQRLLHMTFSQKCLHQYLNHPVSIEQPVFVEKPFLMESGSGLMLYGIIDLSTPTGVWDYKFTSSRASATEYTPQLHLYSWAYHLITGQFPEHSGLLNFLKPTGNLQEISITPDPKNVGQTLDKLEEVHAKIQERQFDPKPGSNCKQCNFADTCEASTTPKT